MARRLEELPIHSTAHAFSAAVSALLRRPGLLKDRNLRDQISDANESVLANMAEGFEQPTDAGLARYLFVSKGSVAEVLQRLRLAQLKGYIRAADLRRCTDMGDELSRMLGGWIRYLAGCNWKDRGRHSVALKFRDKG
jgi:four helix bundle protein